MVTLSRAPNHAVVVNTSFRVRFDRFLLPTTAIRQAICVQRHIGTTNTLDECLAPASFAVTYDPTKREIVFRPQPDDNAGNIALVKGGVYQLTVFPAVSKDDVNGVRAFDGATGTSAVFEFRVSDHAPLADEPDPRPDPKATWCGSSLGATDGASGILTGSCGVDGCHLNSRAADGTLAGAAMDLQFGVSKNGDENQFEQLHRMAEAVRRTAVNHVAHETQTGESADMVDEATNRFGRAMPIVDDSSPGNSYLLYKLLVGRDTESGAWFVAEPERDRLAEAIIVGNAMPLPNKPMGSVKMTKAWVETLSRWIEAGAATPDCP